MHVICVKVYVDQGDEKYCKRPCSGAPPQSRRRSSSYLRLARSKLQQQHHLVAATTTRPAHLWPSSLHIAPSAYGAPVRSILKSIFVRDSLCPTVIRNHSDQNICLRTPPLRVLRDIALEMGICGSSCCGSMKDPHQIDEDADDV